MRIDFRTQSTKTTNIIGYKPFYIQKSGTLDVLDTRAQWGLVAKSNPFPALPNPKEPYANNWLDEDGLDEYNASMYYEPIEYDVSFYVKTYASGGTSAVEVLRTWLGDFFTYVRDGEFRTFDSYTGIGYRKVRYNGYSEDYFRARDTWAAATITVKFKANDPTTLMTLASVTYSPGAQTSRSATTIVPPQNGCTSTTSQSNIVVYDTTVSSPSTGLKMSVYFFGANNQSAPALRIASSGTNISIIHVPSGGFKASTIYLFEYTGSVWDCLGTL